MFYNYVDMRLTPTNKFLVKYFPYVDTILNILWSLDMKLKTFFSRPTTVKVEDSERVEFVKNKTFNIFSFQFAYE